MEAKKISFGFSKINKKPNLLLSKESQKSETNKVELIKCLEGQEIKLVEEKTEEAPLIIPLKENQKTSAALASLIKRKAVLFGEEEPVESVAIAENGENTSEAVAEDTNEEDIEKRAARELLAELNDAGSQGTASNLVLPIVHPDELPLDGAKESNMDDYDNIPIQQFGKAMLRGMGWVEPPPPSKGGPPLDDTPMVRPKGMGLGADKALKAKPLLVKPESNEVLEIKRNAYVRILGGKNKDLYGQIEGFDDHAGRVIVKMAIGGFKEAFNEFLCQPVAKKEYAQYGKCINSTKYEEYKRKENEFGQIILNKEDIAKLDKASIKYEKIKKEKKAEPSSDEDCKIVERKPIRIDLDSREKDRESRDYYKNDKYIKNERDGKRESNRENERERSKAYHRDEERLTKGENTRNYDDKDRKRDTYRDEGKRYQDNGQDRARESHRHNERPHDDTRDRYKDHQQPGSSYERNHKREGDRYRETSRDRYESRHGKDDQRRRQEDKEKNKDYEERKSRQRNNSISNESNSDDDRSQHKKYNKDKKSKKKSKKSKKSKSKYQDSSCDSDSCSSDSSDSEAEKRHKKHKKKTKKSKRQRERSRSRGRR